MVWAPVLLLRHVPKRATEEAPSCPMLLHVSTIMPQFVAILCLYCKLTKSRHSTPEKNSQDGARAVSTDAINTLSPRAAISVFIRHLLQQ